MGDRARRNAVVESHYRPPGACGVHDNAGMDALPLLLTMGDACGIGPETLVKAHADGVLEGCVVGDGASVTSAQAFSSEIGPGAQVGPFAYLRPGTRLAESG